MCLLVRIPNVVLVWSMDKKLDEVPSAINKDFSMLLFVALVNKVNLNVSIVVF